VQQFNSQNGFSTLLGCYVRHTHIQSHMDQFQLGFTRAAGKSCLFPSSRGSSLCLWYAVGGKWLTRIWSSGKMGSSIWRLINMLVKCKIWGFHGGDYEDTILHASEMLAILTLAYGEYSMKKLSVIDWHGPFCSQYKIIHWILCTRTMFWEVLAVLLDSILRIGPQLWPYRWIIHHDNAPAHDI
jgi:hypothetical protein